MRILRERAGRGKLIETGLECVEIGRVSRRVCPPPPHAMGGTKDPVRAYFPPTPLVSEPPPDEITAMETGFVGHPKAAEYLFFFGL